MTFGVVWMLIGCGGGDVVSDVTIPDAQAAGPRSITYAGTTYDPMSTTCCSSPRTADATRDGMASSTLELVPQGGTCSGQDVGYDACETWYYEWICCAEVEGGQVVHRYEAQRQNCGGRPEQTWYEGTCADYHLANGRLTLMRPPDYSPKPEPGSGTGTDDPGTRPNMPTIPAPTRSKGGKRKNKSGQRVGKAGKIRTGKAGKGKKGKGKKGKRRY